MTAVQSTIAVGIIADAQVKRLLAIVDNMTGSAQTVPMLMLLATALELTLEMDRWEQGGTSDEVDFTRTSIMREAKSIAARMSEPLKKEITDERKAEGN